VPSSIQAQPDVQQQLMTLKALTRTTMVVHEAQVLQLKAWGQIALGFMKNLKFRVSPEEKFVEYYGTAPGRAVPNQKRRCEVVHRNVMWLLGDDWETRVKSGSRVIFRSTATVAEPDERRTSKPERSQDR
jgi:hypothetical protein